MSPLTGPTVLLLLLLLAFCQCVSYEQEVELLYPSTTIEETKGSSVKLTCRAKYVEACGLVKVAWSQLNEAEDSCTELAAAGRYLTTVNETLQEDGVRLRQVTTEILHLTWGDQGTFQCNAECDSKAKAKGHFVTIRVKGSPPV